MIVHLLQMASMEQLPLPSLILTYLKNKCFCLGFNTRFFSPPSVGFQHWIMMLLTELQQSTVGGPYAFLFQFPCQEHRCTCIPI